MQILQLYYAFSSRGAGGDWDAVGPQSVGSFFGSWVCRGRGMRATSAGIGLIDVTLSDLGQTRSLGSFGCGVFASGALAMRPSFPALVLNVMAKVHQEEDRRRRAYSEARAEGKRLNWMGDLAGAER